MSKRFKRLRDNAIMAGKIAGYATPFIKRNRVPPGPQPWPKDLAKPATFVDFPPGKAPGHAFLLPASELPCVRAYEGKCKGNSCRYRHLDLGREQDPEAYIRAFMINITNIYGTVAHPTPIGLNWSGWGNVTHARSFTFGWGFQQCNSRPRSICRSGWGDH